MSHLLNPMDHPVCLVTPSHLPPGGTSIEHLPFVMWLVDTMRPRTIVEIGTRSAAAFFASCEVVASRGLQTHCHGLVLQDDAAAPHAVELTEVAALHAYHDPLYGHFSRLKHTRVGEGAAGFADASIDLLHIDASHPLIAPDAQLAQWLPKMSRSGVLLVHGAQACDMTDEVRAAWSAVPRSHAGFDFAHDRGLSVCCVGREVAPPVLAMSRLDEEKAAVLRLAYLTLGARLTAQLKAKELLRALDHCAGERQQLSDRLRDATSAEKRLIHQARALRGQARERAAEALHRDAALERLQERVQTLSAQLAQKDSLVDGLSSTLVTQGAELSSIHRSVGWSLVRRYWNLRARWLPSDTRRGQAYERQRDRFLRLGRNLLGPAPGEPGTALDFPGHGRPATHQGARPWEQPLTKGSGPHMGRRVLIIGELSMPACKRYRIDQKVAMLERLGLDATVLDWHNDEACHNALQFHGLVIFYRVPAFAQTKRLAGEARRLGIPSFYDVDDLVFEPDEYRRSLEVMGLPRKEREIALEGARLYREMLSLCQHGIGSTTLIARQMRAYVAGDVHTLENGLDATILKLADQASTLVHPPRAAADMVTIGYGSGSRTHDADFALAAGALAAVMKQHKHVRLVIHGLLALPAALAGHSDQIFRIPFLDADDYLRAVAGWDINIAPLENTAFNQAKSNIKFIEAAAFRVPSICSATQPFAAVIEHGRNGMLARHPREWEEALRQLVESEPLRRRMGQEAHRTAMARYHPAVLAAGSMLPVVAHLPAAVQSARLKVLVANVLFAPLSFGGATIVAEQLARELAGDGCDVTVFTGLMQPVLPPYQVVRYESLGLPVIAVQLPVGGEASLEHRNPAMKEIFVQALRTLRPDVVHLHSVQWLSASLAEACLEEGVAYVITLHDAWWLCERQFMVREDQRYCGQRTVDLRTCSKCVADSAQTYRRSFYLRQALEGAALLLTPSEFQRQLYVANGMHPDRVVVNKNGVLLPTRPRARRDPQAPVRFAYLGGRAVHKGYFWLKDIFESMPQTDYVLRITDIAQRMGPPSIHADEWEAGGRIEITPPYDQDSMDEFFDSVDVLLIPSLWKESFGLAAREALARGLWVITTASGGVVEDIVDGVNGTIVPIGDAEAFRAALRRAMTGSAHCKDGGHAMAAGIRDYPTQARELKGLLLRASRERAAPASSETASRPPPAVIPILASNADRASARAQPLCPA